MTNYILRRLLLMIPTLIGITFLLFMLVASAPGGIGAGLRFTGGGQTDATSVAIQQAYLNDRYGLDDPPVIQYTRWLARISPIKFGTRDQITPAGERKSLPKSPEPPMLWSWFNDQSPEEAAASVEIDSPLADLDPNAPNYIEEVQRIFRSNDNAYGRARGRLITQATLLEQALATYANQTNLQGATNRKGEPIESVFLESTPDKSHPAWPDLKQQADNATDAFLEAEAARQRLTEIFLAKPFPEAGIPIIPGAVSIASPDLGRSFSRSRPVSELILEALPVTLLLNLIAVTLIYAIAVPSGVLAAVRKGGFLDVGMGALVVALWSFPIPLAGILCIMYLASDQYLGLFPVAGLSSSAADTMPFLPSIQNGDFVRGWLLDRLWHICLPVACLVYGGFAILSKQTRAAMLDNFNADYVRTAKAKGVAANDITFRHVFRNSLLPLITLFVTIFPAMLSGSVVIETIFTVNGMGRLVIEAINLRDRELILASALMIGIVNLLSLLLADILYAIADPRISYE